MALELNKFNLFTPAGDTLNYPFSDSEYFNDHTTYVDLWAPTIGETTENSEKTRTEFREVVLNNTTLYNWSINEGNSHVLRAAMSVEQINKNKRITIGQIHVKDNNRPPLKITFDDGDIEVAFRQTYNQSDDPKTIVFTGIPYNARFTYSITVQPNGLIKVYVGYNGVINSLELMPDSTWADKLLYFKAGVYNLEVASSTTLPTEGSRVFVYKLETVHS